MQRDDIITDILENMTLTKRHMAGQLQGVMHDAQISPAQLEALFIISHQQPMSATALAENRQMTRGAVSQLTEVLETKGLIVRKQDDGDRRSYHLHVTEAGETIVRNAHKRRNEIFCTLMQDLSDEELASWRAIQKKLLTSLENQKPKNPNS